jgi:probable metal-binding protein
MEYHAHEVLGMMLGQTFTDASLISAMHNTFGDDAKYYSCSQNDMTAEQLIAFLKSKGKLVEVDGGYTVNTAPGGSCGH